MWVPKEVVPILADEVRELVVHAEDDPAFDGNDLVIFKAFVLTVLEEKPGGFDSGDMLDKGFTFMIGLIPDLLNRRRDEMDPSHFGMLARLYHRHTIERILGWIEGLDDAWYEENLPGLYRDLGWVRAIQTRTPS